MADRTIFRMIFDALQFHFVEKVGGGGQDKNTDKNTNWANLDELMRKNPLKLAILNFHRPNLYVYLHYTHSRKTFINSFLCF